MLNDPLCEKAGVRRQRWRLGHKNGPPRSFAKNEVFRVLQRELRYRREAKVKERADEQGKTTCKAESYSCGCECGVRLIIKPAPR